MNLYFQFLTQNQSAEVVQLLECARVVPRPLQLKGRVKLHSHGITSYSTFSELDVLIERLREKRFNQLELMPDASRLHPGGRQAHIESLECTLSVSPTCALWFPSSQWRTDGDRASDNRYRTAKSHETALSFHRVSREPSVLGVSVALGTKLEPGALLDQCEDQLVTSLPEVLDGLHLFGCCDVVEPVFIPQLGRSVVMPQMFQVITKVKIPAYPQLGDSFEALHSLMFGSRRVCEGIARVLPKKVTVLRTRNLKDFAVIRLRGINEADTEAARVAGWLVEKEKLAG